MKRSIAIAMIAGCALTAAANAQVWQEIPDAGDMSPQMTIGSGALSQIIGSGTEGDKVDMYCINIVDPARFTASTVGGASFDTQLWLFAMNGMGIAFNDDSVGVQSIIAPGIVTAPGHYMLAISRYDTDARDGAGAQIWNDSPFSGTRAPDGPGAASPLAAWDNAGPDIGEYSIAVAGAEFCQVPAPGALALAGVGGLLIARRKR